MRGRKRRPACHKRALLIQEAAVVMQRPLHRTATLPQKIEADPAHRFNLRAQLMRLIANGQNTVATP